jgi:O-antigen/teichoic acid export membrane protein
VVNKIFKNSMLNLIGWVVPIGITLFTIPFYISRISDEGYGIWVLIGTITGYLSLVQIGIGPAIIKFIAEYKAKEDTEAISNIINAALLFTLVVGILAGILIYVFAPGIISAFNVSPNLFNESVRSLRLGGAFFFLFLLFNVYIAVFSGLQRYDLSNILNILRVVLFAIISCILLVKNYGIYGLVSANVFVNFLISIIGHILVITRVKNYQIRFQPVVKTLKLIFGYSVYSFITQAASLLNSRLAEIMIGLLLGPSQVTYFNVPARLIGLFSSGSSSLGAVLFPLASEMQVENNQARIKQTFLRSSRFFSFLIFPAYILFAFFSKPILQVWISADMASRSAQILTLYSLAYLIAGMTVIPTQFLMGFGKVKFIARFSVGIILVSVLAYYPLIRVFNIVGAGYALLATQLFGLFFIYYSVKMLKIEMKDYIVSNLGPIAVACLLVIPISGVKLLYSNAFDSLITNLAFITAYVIFYLLCCLMFSDVKILVRELSINFSGGRR